ncbi:helix-turn-helix domain-containing protein [Polymorphobacter sp.]|uniref:helix-turn-helix domain-containing protein n=1 Tax=Polymorphobacter sp. TaxID=1909290 RepID=UPI003F71EFB2
MEKGVPIRALSRGIAVLQAINRGGTVSMMEIARLSQVPYPTACRLVQTLMHEGLIEREPARKHYRPTALVQTLAHGFQGDARLVAAARPHIVALTRRLGWPISLSTQVGHSMVIRDSTHSLTTLTFSHYYPGYTLPILECAAGLAYLSWLGPHARAHLLNALKLLPDSANTNIIAMFETGELAEQIRQQGHAQRSFNTFTLNPGKTSSIAVPILMRDHGENDIIGCLTLPFFVSAIKMNEAVERFLAPLQATAIAVAASLAEDLNPTPVEEEA